MRNVCGIWTREDHALEIEIKGLRNGIAHILRGEYFASLKVGLKYVRDYRIAVDAGGHIGLWAIEMAKHFDRVLSFEPLEKNVVCHHMNTEDYTNIELHDYALGAKAGRTGYTEGHNTGSGFTFGNDGTIEVVTIDSYNLPSCGLIKADVEGHEYNVLMGARDTLQRCHPVVIIEDKGLEKKNLGQPLGCAGRLLESYGYKKQAYIRKDSIYVYQGSDGALDEDVKR